MEKRDSKGRFIKGHKSYSYKGMNKGNVPPNYIGLKGICLICSKVFNTKPARVNAGKGKYCSLECYNHSKKGKINPNLIKSNLGRIPWNKDLKGFMAGEKSPNWQGGKTEETQRMRNSLEYKAWRTAVFVRDNYTCQACKKSGVKLNADHIKPFSLFPELRLELSNGRTLCESCHRETPTWGYRAKNYAIL